MGIKLSELKEGSPITLKISSGERKLEMPAMINQIVKDDIAYISLEHNTGKRLSFDNVKIDMEYVFEGVMPICWRNVKIVYYKGEYVMQVSAEGQRNNRRGYFRVGVSMYAQLRREGHGTQQVMMRDISLSGFAITDRSKELGLTEGDKAVVGFEDIGYACELLGRVVRIEDREDMRVYGFEICNLCKGLSGYVNKKQRAKRA